MRGRVEGPPGVVCSDGRTVVRTGDDGTFAFDATGPFVFVCVPTGWRTDQWFVPVAEDVSFTLTREEQRVPFSFAQIADLHMALETWVFGEPAVSKPPVVDALLRDVASRASSASFIIATGDQTNDGTDAELQAWMGCAARSSKRIVAIAGNHDHNSVDPVKAAELGAAFGPGTLFTPYDEHCGPRWFSFDHGGVHFVAIDWTTHHLGYEVEVQEDWVRADLEHVADGTPVIFLTHDLMQTDFFERVGAKPVGSFSGHWHTSRVVRTTDAVHVNTAPATYGGLDYHPAHWRIATWDGTSLSIETVDVGPATGGDRSATAWSVGLGENSYRAGPVVADGLVVASTAAEDEPFGGTLQAFAADTGERAWSVTLGSGVKATPVVVDDAVVAVAVTGETVCVELATGAERWRRHIDDPLRLWTYLRPATDGRLVFVGDTPRFAALDVGSGDVVWQRDDLGQRGNITCHSHPVVVDETLMVAFSAQIPDMWALDTATGGTLWPAAAVGRTVYDAADPSLMLQLPRCPVSGFGADPDGEDIYVIRLGNRLDRIRVADGSVVWSAPVASYFNPAAPLAVGDDVYVSQGDGVVICLTRSDGSERWRAAVTSDSPRRMAPYRAEGGALFGEPALTDDHAIVACGDGRVVWVARADGRIVRTEDLGGVPVASAPAIDAERVYVATIHGTLHALAL